MELEQCVATMQRNAQRIAALVAGVPDEQARWKPDAESWSILEVVNHLLDEEREDFRVLANPIRLDGQRLAGSVCSALGADTESLLGTLGFSAADIEDLRNDGAI